MTVAAGRLWFGASADYTDSDKDGVYVVTSADAAPIEVETGLPSLLGLVWADGSIYAKLRPAASPPTTTSTGQRLRRSAGS